MLKKIFCLRVILASVFLFLSVAGNAQDEKIHGSCDELRQFTFSWQFVDQCGLKTRGGSSKGAGLVLDKLPHPGWLAIQETGLSDYEKDRRAILAMVGGFRTSFDFLETVGYKPNFKPDPPYQSWGTEYVYLVEDRDDFIGLQHILVMQYVDAEGKISEPFVQKHWRQDWQYEKRDTLVYAGNDVRKHKKYSRKEIKGTWAQAVFQVDDSPRYEAVGKWQHFDNFSTWISDETWRPVPRRETSLRKDYQVLVGTNRHTITPTGWVQEEENYKVVLDADGEISGSYPYLSKEIGVNRYERLKDFDFSEGDKYWQATNSYWRDVKVVWDAIIADHKSFTMKRTHEGVPMFMATFTQAEEVLQQSEIGKALGKEQIREVLEKYLK